MSETTKTSPERQHDYTEEKSGMSLTVYRGQVADGRTPLRYKIAKPDGKTFDLSITEWIGVTILVERWQAES